MVTISLHIRSLHYLETTIISTAVRATGHDILVDYWFVRTPTDCIHYKVHDIKKNKMYSIIVNYEPSIENN
jgi:hypothetical protein